MALTMVSKVWSARALLFVGCVADPLDHRGPAMLQTQSTQLEGRLGSVQLSEDWSGIRQLAEQRVIPSSAEGETEASHVASQGSLEASLTQIGASAGRSFQKDVHDDFDARTGEEGELMNNFVEKSLEPVSFPVMSEAALREQRLALASQASGTQSQVAQNKTSNLSAATDQVATEAGGDSGGSGGSGAAAQQAGDPNAPRLMQRLDVTDKLQDGGYERNQAQLLGLAAQYQAELLGLAERSKASTAYGATNASARQQASEHEYMPRHEDCTPQCSYNCSTPVCDQECHPECQSPTCETRCNGTDLAGCVMQCGKPHCSVLCPQSPCSGGGCPQCTTQCSEPMCKLQCPRDQPCHSVCAQPACTYKCKAPTSCPKPKCDMVCETPRSCMGSTHQQIPPLNAGEVAVESFAAPTDLAASSPQSLTQVFGIPGTSVRVNSRSHPSGAFGAPNVVSAVDIPVMIASRTQPETWHFATAPPMHSVPLDSQ